MKTALLSTALLATMAVSSLALHCCAAPSEKADGAPKIVKVSSESSFTQDVLEAKTPVVVDFYADWCGPCRSLEPVLESVAKEYEGKVAFYRINVDKAAELSAKYDISSIPAVKIFKDGKITGNFLGNQRPEAIRKHIDAAIK
jgi:thioredoxin 1